MAPGAPGRHCSPSCDLRSKLTSWLKLGRSWPTRRTTGVLPERCRRHESSASIREPLLPWRGVFMQPGAFLRSLSQSNYPYQFQASLTGSQRAGRQHLPNSLHMRLCAAVQSQAAFVNRGSSESGARTQRRMTVPPLAAPPAALKQAVAASGGGGAAEQPLFRFGLLSDVQYADKVRPVAEQCVHEPWLSSGAPPSRTITARCLLLLPLLAPNRRMAPASTAPHGSTATHCSSWTARWVGREGLPAGMGWRGSPETR